MLNSIELYTYSNTILENVKDERFQTDLSNTLKQICESDDWKYAEVWVPDGKILQCHPANYIVSEKLAEFRKESEDFTFGLGAGLPGRVWLMQKPEWIENLSLEPAIYYRSHLAKKVGLKAGLGVPIMKEETVVAVVVFYNDDDSLKTNNLLAEFIAKVQSLIYL